MEFDERQAQKKPLILEKNKDKKDKAEGIK